MKLLISCPDTTTLEKRLQLIPGLNLELGTDQVSVEIKPDAAWPGQVVARVRAVVESLEGTIRLQVELSSGPEEIVLPEPGLFGFFRGQLKELLL